VCWGKLTRSRGARRSLIRLACLIARPRHVGGANPCLHAGARRSLPLHLAFNQRQLKIRACSPLQHTHPAAGPGPCSRIPRWTGTPRAGPRTWTGGRPRPAAGCRAGRPRRTQLKSRRGRAGRRPPGRRRRNGGRPEPGRSSRTWLKVYRYVTCVWSRERDARERGADGARRKERRGRPGQQQRAVGEGRVPEERLWVYVCALSPGVRKSAAGERRGCSRACAQKRNSFEKGEVLADKTRMRALSRRSLPSLSVLFP